MQLLFLSGSKTLLYSEVERIFGFEHAAVISLWIEEVVLERNSAIFQPGSKRLLWSEIVRFFHPRTCSLFFLFREEAAFWSDL